MSTTRPELPGTSLVRTGYAATRGTQVSGTASYGLRPGSPSPVALLAVDPAIGSRRAVPDARSRHCSRSGSPASPRT